MTLAIGVSCSEGTVLLSDSLAIEVRPDGIPESVVAPWPKVGLLERAGLAYIYSGVGEGPLTDFDGSGDFQADARRLYVQVVSLRAELPAAVLAGAQTLDGRPQPADDALAVLNRHHLVVASMSGDLAAGLLTDDSEEWTGGVFVGGAPYEWWREQPRPRAPTSLPWCLVLAQQIMSRFRRYVYTPMDYLADQGLSETRRAPIRGPSQGLTITPEKVTRWTLGGTAA